nr:uncharacterized protein LOC125644034 [Caretta caretta]
MGGAGEVCVGWTELHLPQLGLLELREGLEKLGVGDGAYRPQLASGGLIGLAPLLVSAQQKRGLGPGGEVKGAPQPLRLFSAPSLSSERRRWELAQIGVENQRLAGQLRQQQSEHAREPWERHWERVELIRNGIARYPRSLRAPQTVPKEQRQEALSSGFPSLGHEERRRANTVPLRMARGAAMPHRGAPGDVGPSPRQRLGQLWRPCPQRSARCEGTVPASGAPQGTGASAQQTTTAAVLSPRGLAR